MLLINYQAQYFQLTTKSSILKCHVEDSRVTTTPSEVVFGGQKGPDFLSTLM